MTMNGLMIHKIDVDLVEIIVMLVILPLENALSALMDSFLILRLHHV
jgi:hypothetical protein